MTAYVVPQAGSQLLRGFTRWSSLPWLLGIFSFPFYLFGSGGAQISTVFLFIAAIGSIGRARKHRMLTTFRGAEVATKWFFYFSAYAFFVQVAWMVILVDASVLIFVFFYAFNLLIFFGIIAESRVNATFPKLVIEAFAYSVLLQIALSMVVPAGAGLRETLFFNNPNQLGYFSLLAAAILTVGAKNHLIPLVLYVPSMLGSVWMAQLSLSKAAMVAGSLLLLYGAFSNLRHALVGGLVVFAIMGTGLLNDRVTAVSDRLDSIGQSDDDNAAARGYDRIWLHPEMLVLGAGEGAVYRWDSFLERSELHSSWGTVLFSYGAVGCVLLSVFFWHVALSLGLASLVPFAAVFLYGLTHMGLRFVPMWVLFALCAAISAQKSANPPAGHQ